MTNRPLRILIIDENAIRAAILEDGLREAGAGDDHKHAVVVHHIRDTQKLLPRIAAVDPDVILIDLENPSRDTLEQMFQVSRLARRPIAMFVDKSDTATVHAAIDAGVRGARRLRRGQAAQGLQGACGGRYPGTAAGAACDPCQRAGACPGRETGQSGARSDR